MGLVQFDLARRQPALDSDDWVSSTKGFLSGSVILSYSDILIDSIAPTATRVGCYDLSPEVVFRRPNEVTRCQTRTICSFVKTPSNVLSLGAGTRPSKSHYLSFPPLVVFTYVPHFIFLEGYLFDLSGYLRRDMCLTLRVSHMIGYQMGKIPSMEVRNTHHCGCTYVPIDVFARGTFLDLSGYLIQKSYSSPRQWSLHMPHLDMCLTTTPSQLRGTASIDICFRSTSSQLCGGFGKAICLTLRVAHSPG